ncbi:MAG: site-specific integrase, partial [Acidimicrobiales bacterium]
MPWQIEGFSRSIEHLAPATIRAYLGDVSAMIEWAERAGAAGPDQIDRLVLRRYLAFLSTRGMS